MPTKVEKDAYSGMETTGHEWDGIKELNRPLPKWWIYVLWATVLWSLAYYVLYPAIPGLSGHTTGVLDWSRRSALTEEISQAKAGQASFREAIAGKPVDEIAKEPELLSFALAGGRAVFADNCAPCHGSGATGGRGFPSLADDDWLWGGTLEAIHTTLVHGIRSGDEEARANPMPRFGVDELLTEEEISDVAEYVLSLSGKAEDSAAAGRGKEIFAEQCVACHGEKGEGNVELGAPRLDDEIWLYGGSKDEVVATIRDPRLGVMPAWGRRLDETTLKMLAVYVHSLGGGQ